VQAPPTVLVIAGSDSGGGAGIQADLRALTDHGVFGATAITAVTAQNTLGVRRVDALSAGALRAQLDAVGDDLAVHAVKIGMLGTAELTLVVADWLRARALAVPVVLDPVMVATSGDRLLDEDAVEALVHELAPLASVLTPNVPEAALLAGATTDDRGAVLAWARGLGGAVLLTGGDAPGDDVVDVLVDAGVVARTWRSPRLAGGPFHGTGCTLASALAAGLASGRGLEDAADGAIAYVRQRLACAFKPGAGAAVGGFLTVRSTA
jgi:hydroxymethylpyrimidine/phosphomethylpyrimidine kinase